MVLKEVLLKIDITGYRCLEKRWIIKAPSIKRVVSVGMHKRAQFCRNHTLLSIPYLSRDVFNFTKINNAYSAHSQCSLLVEKILRALQKMKFVWTAQTLLFNPL